MIPGQDPRFMGRCGGAGNRGDFRLFLLVLLLSGTAVLVAILT